MWAAKETTIACQRVSIFVTLTEEEVSEAGKFQKFQMFPRFPSFRLFRKVSEASKVQQFQRFQTFQNFRGFRCFGGCRCFQSVQSFFEFQRFHRSQSLQYMSIVSEVTMVSESCEYSRHHQLRKGVNILDIITIESVSLMKHEQSSLSRTFMHNGERTARECATSFRELQDVASLRSRWPSLPSGTDWAAPQLPARLPRWTQRTHYDCNRWWLCVR